MEELFDVVGVLEHNFLHVLGKLVFREVWKGAGAHLSEVKYLVDRGDEALVATTRVIVAASGVHVALALLAGEHLVHERVVDLLFPAVRARTEGLQRTTLVVVADESATLPVLTQLLWVVVKEVRLAAEVLPVVGVNALRLVVLSRQERAPLRLEVEHEELGRFRVLVHQSCL